MISLECTFSPVGGILDDFPMENQVEVRPIYDELSSSAVIGHGICAPESSSRVLTQLQTSSDLIDDSPRYSEFGAGLYKELKEVPLHQWTCDHAHSWFRKCIHGTTEYCDDVPQNFNLTGEQLKHMTKEHCLQNSPRHADDLYNKICLLQGLHTEARLPSIENSFFSEESSVEGMPKLSEGMCDISLDVLAMQELYDVDTDPPMASDLEMYFKSSDTLDADTAESISSDLTPVPSPTSSCPSQSAESESSEPPSPAGAFGIFSEIERGYSGNTDNSTGEESDEVDCSSDDNSDASYGSPVIARKANHTSKYRKRGKNAKCIWGPVRRPGRPRKERISISSDEEDYPCRRRRKGMKGNHLWEFISDLLKNEQYNPQSIRWEDKNSGVFKIIRSEHIAKAWGRKKSNPRMTYEKLSRAMRYYYKREILERVDGRRLVYKFGKKSFGWNEN